MNSKLFSGLAIIFVIAAIFGSCDKFGSLSGNIDEIREEMRVKLEFTVTFDANGGNFGTDDGWQLILSKQETVKYGKTVPYPTEPSQYEKWFYGWYTNQSLSNKWDFDSDTVSKDITLYAKWDVMAPGYYRVTFDLTGGFNKNGGAGEPYQDVLSDEKVIQPELVKKDGSYLVGWYRNADYSGTKWNFADDIPAGHMMLHAKWEALGVNQFVFRFIGNNGIPGQTDVPVAGGSTFAKALIPAVSKTNSTFGGWFTDDACEISPWYFDENPVSGSMDIFAKWNPLNQFTVNFRPDGGSPAPAQKVVTHGEEVPKPTDPEKAGFTFEGWFKEHTYVNEWIFTGGSSNKVTENISLYAKWEREAGWYYITLVMDGGTGETTELSVFEGAGDKRILPQPSNPVKAGYYFAGWYKDNTFSDDWDFTDDIVTGDMSLFAKWESSGGKFVVTFIANGAQTVPLDQAVTEGTKAAQPASVEKPNPQNVSQPNAFAGWYTDPQCTDYWRFDTDTVGSGNTSNGTLTLYAKWNDFGYKTINFHYNALGRKWVHQETVSYGAPLPAHPTALNRDKNPVAAWNEKPDGTGTAWTTGKSVNISEGVLVLYAKWEKSIVVVAEKSANSTLDTQFKWINSNAAENTEYVVKAYADESLGAGSSTGSGRNLNAKNDVVINLSSSGANRTVTLSSAGYLIQINSGISLVLENITLKGYSTNDNSLVRVNSSAALIINDGAKITGNTKRVIATAPNDASVRGGGLYISGGTVEMKGGEISGNSCLIKYSLADNTAMNFSTYGGGAYITDSGNFTLESGEISGNIAKVSISAGGWSSLNANIYASGGGLYLGSGTLTINGGKISGNECISDAASEFSQVGEKSISICGGGICAGGTLTINGGKISGNTAAGSRQGNAYGGGIYMTTGRFDMTNGEITGNTAKNSDAARGGGVYCSSAVFTKTGGTITGNPDAASNLATNLTGALKSSAGHAVYINSSSKRRETTAGPSINLNSATADNWGQ